MITKRQSNAVQLAAPAVALTATVLTPTSCGGDAQAQHAVFTLTSADLANSTFDNKFVLKGFGCSGGNVSPAVSWSNVRQGTQSLALQMYDPDAPSGSGFWHWAVYNIPLTVTSLPQGAGNSATVNNDSKLTQF